MAKWEATAFTADREEDYSTSFQGDAVTIEHAHGKVKVEVTDKHRRAYFILPEKLFADTFKLPDAGVRISTAKKPKPKEDPDDFDFG